MLRFQDVEKGIKVIIRSNRHNLTDSWVLGTVLNTPEHFTSPIYIRYFSFGNGEVENKFNLNELEEADANSCAEVAAYKKRQAIEFFEQAKKRGYVPKGRSAEEA